MEDKDTFILHTQHDYMKKFYWSSHIFSLLVNWGPASFIWSLISKLIILSGALTMKLLRGECHRTSLMRSQYWFRQWLCAFRQQANTQANDQDLHHHMASLGHNKLNTGLVSQFCQGIIDTLIFIFQHNAKMSQEYAREIKKYWFQYLQLCLELFVDIIFCRIYCLLVDHPVLVWTNNVSWKRGKPHDVIHCIHFMGFIIATKVILTAGGEDGSESM